MVLSRAAFGRVGNGLPSVVSYLLLVGWETVLVSLATLATATVFDRLGWSSGDGTKVVAFVVVAAVIVAAGVLGFDAIMRIQKWLTLAMIVVTGIYVYLTFDHIDLDAGRAVPDGPTTAVIGATVLVLTGFGVGWVNSAADYSRYLPRNVRTSGVVFWPTFGGSLPVVILVAYGVLLCAGDDKLSAEIAADPIGALTTLLPTWFLVPFALVAVAGLVSGAILDIYSSGLTLLTLGLRAPRWTAAAFDGVLMILGTIYIVWIADDFLTVFMAFLIILGVPMAAWCGIFLCDLFMRRYPYDERALFSSTGDGTDYGLVRWESVLLLVAATVVGWGLVIDTTGAGKHLGWLGYLLEPLGLGGKDGDWAYANLGVPVALVIGFLGYLAARVAHRAPPGARAGRRRGARRAREHRRHRQHRDRPGYHDRLDRLGYLDRRGRGGLISASPGCPGRRPAPGPAACRARRPRAPLGSGCRRRSCGSRSGCRT